MAKVMALKSQSVPKTATGGAMLISGMGIPGAAGEAIRIWRAVATIPIAATTAQRAPCGERCSRSSRFAVNLSPWSPD